MSSVNATGVKNPVLTDGSVSTAAVAAVSKAEDQVKAQAVSAADKVTISEEARLLLESDSARDTGVEPPKYTTLDTGIEPPKNKAPDTGVEPPK